MESPDDPAASPSVLRRRPPPVIIQFARFAVVGVLSFAVDYGLFLVLHEVVGVQYLLASTTSFTISLVLNYVLTLRYVFEAREGRNVAKEFTLYIGLNIVALGLNQAILYLTVDGLAMAPALGKIIATAVVMIYNFISRKLLIERPGARQAASVRDGAPGSEEQHA